MRTASLLFLLLLGSCHPTTLIPRPAEGYRAIRVLETMRFPHVIGQLPLNAGAVYIADRVSDRDGQQVWCPPHPDEFGCIGWDGAQVTFQADRGLSRLGPFAVPAGSIEEFRLR